MTEANCGSMPRRTSATIERDIVLPVGQWLIVVLLFTCAHLCPYFSPCTMAATTQPADDYQLVWSDEFNTDGPLNPKDWRYENGFVRNLELQWYQPENATCKDGCLIIEARRERRPNPRYIPTTLPASDPRAWRNRENI